MFGVLNTAALVVVGVLSSASVLMPLFACICACMHVQLAVQSDSVASIGTCGAWPDGVITGGLTLNQMSVHTAQVSAPRQQQECPDLRRSLTTSHPTLLPLCSWCACCPHLLSHPPLPLPGMLIAIAGNVMKQNAISPPPRDASMATEEEAGRAGRNFVRGALLGIGATVLGVLLGGAPDYLAPYVKLPAILTEPGLLVGGCWGGGC